MFVKKARDFLNIKLIRYRKVHNHCSIDFPPCFQSTDVEQGWYEVWEKNKYFQPKENSDKTYRMLLPPPNITGTLHLGHALTITVQDILARWYLMKGYQVIWIPGFDHAGIATQAVVEKYLHKTQNIQRTDMTKEEFLKVINEWQNDKSNIIKNQLKSLGAGLDWSREYFTMNEHHSKAVTEAFITLSKRNLLYRNKSFVNWSPVLGSTLSDIEVEFESLNGKVDLLIPNYDKKITFGQIFEISYNLKDSDKKLSIATTRPETLLGDVALAIHPDDDRYSQFVGQKVKHPLNDTYLPVVTDPNVKMSFGTGIVKITPAHNKLDFNVAKNYNLNIIEIIGEDGKLTEKAGQYQGLPRFIAREKIVTDLANLGSLKSVKDHKMLLPRCLRTGDIVELLLREQWFINCKDMASRALEVVENGLLKMDPCFHNQTWCDWLTDINYRDWCVSRQLWWGHKIPAYYCTVHGKTEWVVASSKEEGTKIFTEKYGNNIQVQQDSDVLDTWFSSALLPLSSLGWPSETAEFQKYYPLSLMETGHDILFFWVARMVMLGLELTNKLPFSEVLLHGVLCDAQEKKMSKSRGNVIFPENVVNGISLEKLNEQAENSFELGILNKFELKRTLSMNKKIFPAGIPKCGIDALRFTLCSHNIKERTVFFNIIECEQNKFFMNKIWQASRYSLQMIKDDPIVIPTTYTMIDQWILSRLSRMVEIVNSAFDEKEFYKAIRKIRTFTHNEFCDYYLEGTKLGFKNMQPDVIVSHKYTLAKCLEVTLKVLAPITPYFSDDLYSKLSKKLSIFECKTSLLESSYPTYGEFKHLRNIELEKEMSEVIKVISSIRTLLSYVSKRTDVKGCIIVNTIKDQELYEKNMNLISGASKFYNIEVLQAKNYEITENIISSNIELDCLVNLIINNETLLNEAKQKIEKNKMKAKKKLEKSVKLMNKKQYLSNNSKQERMNRTGAHMSTFS